MATPDDPNLDRLTDRGQLKSLAVGGASAWSHLGFGAGPFVLGTTIIAPQEGDGIVAAHIAGVDDLDGLALDRDATPEAPADSPTNGIVGIDHVVVNTPDMDRTIAAFEAQRLEVRRQRRFETKDGTRVQTFIWLGDVICEIVGSDSPTGDGPATWWGLAVVAADLDATATEMGDGVSSVRDAVQPGRRVATVRADCGLTVPLLVMSPHRRAGTATE